MKNLDSPFGSSCFAKLKTHLQYKPATIQKVNDGLVLNHVVTEVNKQLTANPVSLILKVFNS